MGAQDARSRREASTAAFAVSDPASGLQADGVQTPADAFHVDAADEGASPAQAAFSWNGAERVNVP
jgi:hypothetical protein